MKRFLKYCALFVLPLLIAAVPMEWALRQVPNPYQFKYAWMQAHADEVETLVLGSSHAFYGIRPEFLEGKAFNLANVSQGTKQDLFLLKYWADRYKRLKTVVMPISYYSWFDPELENSTESYLCRYYKIYMDCDLYPDWSFHNLELSDRRTAVGKLEKLFKKGDDPGYDDYGWGTLFRLSMKDIAAWNDGSEAAAAVERHTVKPWDHIAVNYGRMEEMAAFCKQRGVQLVLITTPCWHAYYDHLDKVQYAKMHELIHQLQKAFGIPYLDYMKDPRFVADDFYDSNHLSEIGAEKFTKILAADIKRYGQTQLGE